MDKVPMSTLDLDSVHSCAGGTCGSRTKGVDDLMDLGDGDLQGARRCLSHWRCAPPEGAIASSG